MIIPISYSVVVRARGKSASRGITRSCRAMRSDFCDCRRKQGGKQTAHLPPIGIRLGNCNRELLGSLLGAASANISARPWNSTTSTAYCGNFERFRMGIGLAAVRLRDLSSCNQ